MGKLGCCSRERPRLVYTPHIRFHDRIAKLDYMNDKPMRSARRTAIKKIVFPAAVLPVWILPVVHSVLLPVHAQASLCVLDDIHDILGKWQLEMFEPVASVSEFTLFSDGSVEHEFLNAWQYSGGEFRMTQGTTWVLTGSLVSCNALSGTYVNIFTLPIIGNVIVRQGDWVASKLS